MLLGILIGIGFAGLVAGCLAGGERAFHAAPARLWWWAWPVCGAGLLCVAGLAYLHGGGANVGSWAFASSGALLFAVGVRRKRPRGKRVIDVWSPIGLAGMATAIVAVAGLVWHDSHPVAGWSLIVTAAAAWLALALRETLRGESGFARVRAKLDGAEDWPAPLSKEDSDGINAYEDDRARGKWKGVPTWIELLPGQAVGHVLLDNWPQTVAVMAAGDRDANGATLTGDPAFDDQVELSGDERDWRPRLNARVRALWIELVEQGASFDPDHGKLRVSVPESDAEALAERLDVAAQLARAIGELDADPDQAVLAAAAGEPIAAVRAGHYRYLVGRGWSVPMVLRTAARDEDPDIAAWATAQLPPQDGPFR